MISAPPDVPPGSRIAALARAARIIAHGCKESGYSDRKHRRLLWETAFFILEGYCAPYIPSPAPKVSPERTSPMNFIEQIEQDAVDVALPVAKQELISLIDQKIAPYVAAHPDAAPVVEIVQGLVNAAIGDWTIKV